jgi:hypothetical protein
VEVSRLSLVLGFDALFGAVPAGFAKMFVDPGSHRRAITPCTRATVQGLGGPIGVGTSGTTGLQAVDQVSRCCGNGSHPRGVEIRPHAGLQPDWTTSLEVRIGSPAVRVAIMFISSPLPATGSVPALKRWT